MAATTSIDEDTTVVESVPASDSANKAASTKGRSTKKRRVLAPESEDRALIKDVQWAMDNQARIISEFVQEIAKTYRLPNATDNLERRIGLLSEELMDNLSSDSTKRLSYSLVHGRLAAKLRAKFYAAEHQELRNALRKWAKCLCLRLSNELDIPE